jgi:signal transduction histidine kinase
MVSAEVTVGNDAAERDLLLSMVEEFFDDLLILDDTGTVLYAMPNTAARVSGDVVGMRPSDWLSPISAETLLRAAQTALDSSAWLDASLRLKGGEGDDAVLEVAIAPFRRIQGRVLVVGRNLLVSLLEADEERREREKELACLYQVGQAIEEAATVEAFFEELPEILRRGFRYPSQTRVCIQYGDDAEFGDAAPAAVQVLDTDLIIGGVSAGVIRVWSRQDVAFLVEEHKMMAEVGRMTTKAIEKYRQGLDLEQSLRRLRTLLRAIPDRIVLLDTNYNVLISNDPEDADPRGHRCFRHYYKRPGPCNDCPVTEALESGKPAVRRWRSRRRQWEAKAFPVLREDGGIDGVVEYVKDVTQEARVQEQLVHADKMASLGQLTAGVAHEINNPTQFIRENIRIVREALTDLMPILKAHHAAHPDLRVARLPFPFFEEQVPLLAADIEVGATRIRDIVASLKQYARSDQGKLDEEVDLGQIVATSLRLTHNQLKNTVEVIQEIDPVLPSIRGNVQQIEQVLVNILINACQAIQGARRGPTGAVSAKGRIRITGSHDRARNQVRLVLADDGPGMRPDVVRRIFDPFFTTKQDAGGTGLGLSIVYGIIEKHGGDIDVESEPGQGTEFTITLPVIAKETHGEQYPPD